MRIRWIDGEGDRARDLLVARGADGCAVGDGEAGDFCAGGRGGGDEGETEDQEASRHGAHRIPMRATTSRELPLVHCHRTLPGPRSLPVLVENRPEDLV